MNQNEILQLHEIISDKSVDPVSKALFPVSKSTWYRGIKAGLYPLPVRLSSRRVGWLRSDIDACIAIIKQRSGGYK